MLFNFKTYQELINYAKLQQRTKNDFYYEDHHILPKFMGGTEDSETVLLTLWEHILAHYLLSKENTKTKYILGNINSCGLIIGRNKKNLITLNEIEEILQNPEKLKIIEEIKQAQKGIKKGWFWITNGILNKTIYNYMKIPEGWYKGRFQKGNKLSYEQKQNARGIRGIGIYIHKNFLVKRIKPEQLEKFILNGWSRGSIDKRKNKSGRSKAEKMFWINNGIKSKQIKLTEDIPENWYKGRLKMTNYEKQKLKGPRNFIWITDGIQSKTHHKNQLIPNGWKKGRKINF
jgi:hypothetical protein